MTNINSVSATWSDALAGVDPATLTLSLDGQALTTTVSGATVTATVQNVSAGIHKLATAGADLAGNLQSTYVIFTLVTISADDATATIRSSTIQVNPNGNTVPPSQIVFHAPSVDVAAFKEYLNASTRVGFGTFSRSFYFDGLQVVFSNGTGGSTTVTLSRVSATYSTTLAVLAPSADTVTASVKVGALALPDISVAVPSGYGGSGATATLQTASTSLGTPTSGSTVLASSLPTQLPVAMTLETCLTDAAVCSPTSLIDALSVSIAGTWVGVFAPAHGPADPDTQHSANDPGCAPLAVVVCGQQPNNTDGIGAYTCPNNAPDGGLTLPNCGLTNVYNQVQNNGAGVGFDSSLALGCGNTVYGIGNLCNLANTNPTPYAQLFQNVGIYSSPGCPVPNSSPSGKFCQPDPHPDHFAIWQQNHAIGATSVPSLPCPNGGQGSVTSTLQRIVANYVTPYGPATYMPNVVATTDRFKPDGEIDRTLGTLWAAEIGPNTSPGKDKAPFDAGTGYRILNALDPSAGPGTDSWYGSGTGLWTDSLGQQHVDPGQDPIFSRNYNPANTGTSWWPQSGYQGAAPTNLEMFSGMDTTAQVSATPTATAIVTAVFSMNFPCS